MTVRLGGGAYAFEVNEDCARKFLPEIVLGDVAAVHVEQPCFRLVGSHTVMAGQMRRLAGVARFPT